MTIMAPKKIYTTIKSIILKNSAITSLSKIKTFEILKSVTRAGHGSGDQVSIGLYQTSSIYIEKLYTCIWLL